MRASAVAALAGIVIASASPARAGAAANCGELWAARNSIYKSGGYCFKTSRAIQAFGNAGCRYDDVRDVPLSANARQNVQEIVRQETMLGCRD